MTTTTTQDPCRVKIGSVALPVRLSFLHAHTPTKKKDDNGNVVIDEDTGRPVLLYSAQIRVDKRDKAAKAAIDAAVQTAKADFFGKKVPPDSMLKLPLRDGDAEADSKEDESLRGFWFFNCSSKRKPEVVGPRRDPETQKFPRVDESDIKSGDWAIVTVNFYGFSAKSKGVAVGLGNIQFIREGEALGNARSAESDFDDEDGDDPTGPQESVL